MKILGIKKLYADTKKLRCTFETDVDLDYTVEVDLESSGKLNKYVFEKLQSLSGELLTIFGKEDVQW